MKVGDYVRTKNNNICKILEKKFNEIILIDLYLTDISGYLMEIDIKKSSPNIIDLIEVGDYVNGARVTNFMFDDDKKIGVFVEATAWGYDANEIKSIVTKEQFESMEYRIGE